MKFDLEIPQLLEVEDYYDFDHICYSLNDRLIIRPKVKVKKIMNVGRTWYGMLYTGRLIDPENKMFLRDSYKKLNQEEEAFHGDRC